MIEVNAYMLENNLYYNEIDYVYYNDIKYMLLVNENDINDRCIRKLKIIDGDEYISVLDDEEFAKVSELLINKNKELIS